MKLKVRAEARKNQTPTFFDLNITGADAVSIIDPTEIYMGDRMVNGRFEIGFARKFMSDRITRLADIEDWHNNHEKLDDRLLVVECNVVNISEGRADSASDILVVDDKSLGMGGGVLGVTCWLPKEIPKNFHINSRGIYVFATTGMNKRDGTITLNVLSVWTPESERIKVIPKPLASGQIQERIEPAVARVPTAEQPF